MYVLSTERSHLCCSQLVPVVTGELWGSVSLIYQSSKSVAEGSAFSLCLHEGMQDGLLWMGDPDVIPNPSVLTHVDMCT